MWYGDVLYIYNIKVIACVTGGKMLFTIYASTNLVFSLAKRYVRRERDVSAISRFREKYGVVERTVTSWYLYVSNGCTAAERESGQRAAIHTFRLYFIRYQ